MVSILLSRLSPFHSTRSSRTMRGSRALCLGRLVCRGVKGCIILGKQETFVNLHVASGDEVYYMDPIVELCTCCEASESLKVLYTAMNCVQRGGLPCARHPRSASYKQDAFIFTSVNGLLSRHMYSLRTARTDHWRSSWRRHSQAVHHTRSGSPQVSSSTYSGGCHDCMPQLHTALEAWER